MKAPPKAKKFDVKRLRNVQTATDFKNRTRELLGDPNQENESAMEEVWVKVKNALLKSGEEKVGFAKPRKTDRFATARTNDFVDKLQSTSCKKERRRLAQKIRRSSRRDEESFWSKTADILQKPFSSGDAKTLFGTIKSVMGNGASITETLLDENGTLLSDKDACLKQFTTHFQEQLNNPQPTNIDQNLVDEAETALPDPRISIVPPTEEEVSKVLRSLKEGKAAGLDSVPPEFFKIADTELTPWITKLLAG